MALLLPACAGAGMESKHSSSMPETDGQAVIDYITQENPYQKWKLWPGKDKLYKGQHPHGAFLTTYVNAGAAKALEAKAGKLPNGAIVVKENYTPEKKLAAVTVMYRKSGYAPAAGDYFWLKYAPDGTIQKSGQVKGCINCHKSVKANDWLFTGPVK
ncbi:MAG: cytochrome P460 family protein [Desulfuromonadales bacterium]|nr:cytochrome P460 family protein [Desulfuromonadales bacterium]NIS39227.1 cytochrome P460 family protein [Desulfuromonadales bacterium]